MHHASNMAERISYPLEAYVPAEGGRGIRSFDCGDSGRRFGQRPVRSQAPDRRRWNRNLLLLNRLRAAGRRDGKIRLHSRP